MIFIATQPLLVSPKQQVEPDVAHELDQLEVNRKKSGENFEKRQRVEAIDDVTDGKVVHSYIAYFLILAIHQYLKCILSME